MEVTLLMQLFTGDKYMISPQNNTAFQNTNDSPHLFSLGNLKGIANFFFFFL